MMNRSFWKVVLTIIIVCQVNIMHAQFCEDISPSLVNMHVRFDEASVFLDGENVLNSDLSIYSIKPSDNGIECCGFIEYLAGGPATITINGEDSFTTGYGLSETVNLVIQGAGGCLYDSIVINGDPNFNLEFAGGSHKNITKIEAFRKSSVMNFENPMCQKNNGSIMIQEGSGLPPFEAIWSHDTNFNGFIAEDLEPGEYTISVFDALGCVEEFEVELTDESIPPEVSLPVDTFLCAGDIIVFEFDDNFSFKWSTEGEIISNEPDIALDSGGEYTLQIENDEGCINDYEIEVSEIQLPSFDLGVDTSICANSEILLSGPEEYSYQWNTNSVEQNIIVQSAGRYSLTVIDEFACRFTDTIDIGVIEEPDNTILSMADIYCIGDTLDLWTQADENDSLYWSTENVAFMDQSKDTISLIIEHEVSITLNTNNRCFESTDEITLDVFERQYELQDSLCFVSGGEIEAEVIGGNQFLWYGNDRTSFRDETSAKTKINMGSSDYVYVNITDEYCLYNDSVFIEIVQFNEDFIPHYNAISPNGDGKNDQLQFDNLDKFHLKKLSVFDRWGKVVYESSFDYQNDWGGTQKDGKLLPKGNYYYLLQLDENTIKSPLYINYE